MRCENCPYYWAYHDEEFPSCKYHYNDGYAPCEIEDQEKETEDYDECFDLLEELMEQNADVLKRLKEM